MHLTEAIVFSSIAGLATLIGGLLPLLFKKVDSKILGLGLSFSAGVMIYLSFMEILPQGQRSLALVSPWGKWISILSFFGGILCYFVIDKFLPENTHEEHLVEEAKFTKLASVTFLAMLIHNFPEGMSVFSLAAESPDLSLNLVLAIAIHNIPEGMIISAACLGANQRSRAIVYVLLASLVEPLGGLIGYFVFKWVFKSHAIGITFCFVAGMMVFLSLEQLLPAARKMGSSHLAAYGVIVGMLLMALVL